MSRVSTARGGASPPLPTGEVHAFTAPDGWVLRCVEYAPEGATRGVVIAGHAMMVDGRTLAREDRPSVASVLVERGFRVWVPDLRGRGMSGPTASEGGQWNYDDHVADVGVWVRAAREAYPDEPLHLLGHSLFGNASLAWLGQQTDAPVRTLALLCVDIWGRSREPRRWRWWVKRALFSLTEVLVRARGYLPARRLRAGTADESAAYWAQFGQWMRRGTWQRADGTVDYEAGVASVKVPTLHVLSRGDRLYAVPEAASRLTRALPRRTLKIVGRVGGRGPSPGHMTLVTDPRHRDLWAEIAAWIAARS